MGDRGRARFAGMLPDIVRSAILARRDRGAGIGPAILERCLGRAALGSGHGVVVVVGVIVEPRAGLMIDDIVFVIVIARRFAQQPFTIGDRDAVIVGVDRSEERRVGKECRSRWSP